MDNSLPIPLSATGLFLARVRIELACGGPLAPLMQSRENHDIIPPSELKVQA